MTKSNIVLASGSKIRRQILSSAGLEFEVVTKPIDENSIKRSMLAAGAPLKDIADALAEAKSMRVSSQRGGFIIGADQIMVMDNHLFDKPADMDEVRERLIMMRGKTHYLIGAVVICESGFPVWRHLAKTKLEMRDFSDAFLDEYIKAEGEELLHSVGAYRFEGRGAQLFSNVEGDFFSILGLSLLPVLDFLRNRGAISA